MDYSKEPSYANGRFTYGNRFPNPFFDIATTYMPRNLKQSLAWCEYVFFTNGTVRAATERIVQYFITEIQYKSSSTNSKKIKQALEEYLNIKSVLTNIGIDYITYGNSISSVYFPFRRMLQCPKCKLELDATKFEYTFDNYKYRGKCPCGELVEFECIDHKDMDPKNINIIRLDPKLVDINYNILSGKSEYYWEMPQNLKFQVQNKNKFIINSTPSEIIDAIRKNESFKFNSEFIFHMRAPTISGVNIEWGFPPFLNILKLNFYNVLLRRANEAIALDFIVPFRTISPGMSSQSQDPAAMFALQSFVSEMQSMVTRHRFDPDDIQIAPFPINYQAFGAEKKALDVTEEIRAVNEEQLNALNYPAELFYNNLKVQAFPPALRLFENTWTHLVKGLNDYLQWITNHVCDFMRWQREEVSLTPCTIADDIEKRQVLLQLAAGQQISLISALKAYGLDFQEEQKRRVEEQKIMADVQKDFQTEMQAQSTMGEAVPQGGGSIFDTQAQAQQIAQTWLSIPYEQRRIEMNKLQQANRTLYALAKDFMDKMRGSAATQQGMQNMAQMGMTGPMGGGGMPPGQPPM